MNTAQFITIFYSEGTSSESFASTQWQLQAQQWENINETYNL